MTPESVQTRWLSMDWHVLQFDAIVGELREAVEVREASRAHNCALRVRETADQLARDLRELAVATGESQADTRSDA